MTASVPSGPGLREQLAEALEVAGPMTPYLEKRVTDALLPVVERHARQRAAEAEAAIERVRAWAAMNDDMAREYDEAANSVTDPVIVFDARERAKDCRAIAEGVRRALDPTTEEGAT